MTNLIDIYERGVLGDLMKYGGLVGGIVSAIELDGLPAITLPIIGGLVYLIGSIQQKISDNEDIDKKLNDLETRLKGNQ